MKKYITFIILTFSALFAEKTPRLPELSLQEIEKLNRYGEEPNSYSYWQAGSSFMLSHIGYGKRTRYLNNKKGRDLSFSYNMCVPYMAFSLTGNTYNSIGKDFTEASWLSLKYSFLRYESKLHESSYKGIGFEIYTCPGRKFLPIPNIELVFGKEYEKRDIKHAQLGINLIPAVATGLLMVGGVAGNPYAVAFAFGTATGIVNYSIGF
ncbi:MAG TPA: hypothetical protein P5048_05170 [Chlamydiales bacterium]|nr:hypothetical protein [Chlamydiales bacterium]